MFPADSGEGGGLMSWTPWLVALAPLALMLVGLTTRAEARPFRVARAGFIAALLGLGVAVAAAVTVALHGPQITPTWGIRGAGLGLYVDAVSATIFVLVSFVGATVIRYSRNYLDGDPNHRAFIRRLCLTVAAVELLVLSGNLLMLVASWIATSVLLNGLLIFYGERRGAVLAARKKFVVSRIGDLCLVGASAALYAVFGGLDYETIFTAASSGVGGLHPLVMAAAVLIACAAIMKSAQFPLHGWILEVMETPTPVSALLHAGIINAGGFVVIRFADVMVMSAPALHLLAIVGGISALFGSLVMLTQTSVKVSLAYSTVAQMGFMLLQCGLGAFSASLLHIVAHSLYKAHAFLSSGSVIDLLRASWSPSPSGRPHPARFLIALVLVLGATCAVAAAFGATFSEKPGVFALGAVLMMSLTLLIGSAIDERFNPSVVARTLGAAIGVGVLYFALQAGAGMLFASSLPATVPLSGSVDLAIVVAVIAAFAGVTLLQSQLGAVAKTAWGQAAYVHLSHGLYVNTIANRLALALWPARGARVP
jgi:NADH:ubiquinone oxidoreductase subunit 2 (subunit N)